MQRDERLRSWLGVCEWNMQLKSIRSLVASGALALACAAVVGCRGPTFIVQQYAGPVRPQETIATFRVNGYDSVRLLVLDGDDVASPLDVDSRIHVELLPGRHTVVVQDAKDAQSRSGPIPFDAEPGRFYRASFVDGTARVFEVERGNDAAVRDVTASAEPPPAAP